MRAAAGGRGGGGCVRCACMQCSFAVAHALKPAHLTNSARPRYSGVASTRKMSCDARSGRGWEGAGGWRSCLDPPICQYTHAHLAALTCIVYVLPLPVCPYAKHVPLPRLANREHPAKKHVKGGRIASPARDCNCTQPPRCPPLALEDGGDERLDGPLVQLLVAHPLIEHVVKPALARGSTP